MKTTQNLAEQHKPKKKSSRLKKFAKISGLALGLTALSLYGAYKYTIGPHKPEYQNVAAITQNKKAVDELTVRVMAARWRAYPEKAAQQPPVTAETLRDAIISELQDGFGKNGTGYLNTLLKDGFGVMKLQIALTDKDFSTFLRDLFDDEGVALFVDDNEKRPRDSPLLDALKDRDTRAELAKTMITDEGKGFMNSLASTSGGDYLLGALFNSKGGAYLMADLLSTKEGRDTAAEVLDGMTKAQPLNPQPPLPDFQPTDFGAAFAGAFQTDQGAVLLAADMLDQTKREGYVTFFKEHTPEARSILRQVISTPEGRQRMAAVMVSPGGQAFLERLGEEKLGAQIGGDDLWNSADGRAFVALLLKTPEGRAALIKMMTGFGILADAIAAASAGS